MKKIYEKYGAAVLVIPAVVVVFVCLLLFSSGRAGANGDTGNHIFGGTVFSPNGETEGGKRGQETASAPKITMDVPDKTMEQEITVSGTVEDENGVAAVVVNVGNRPFKATINEDGTWSADIKLFNGDNNISATATNTAGITASVHGMVFVDISVPVLKVNGLPNITKDSRIAVSGSAKAESGISSLIVTVHEKEYDVILNEDGTWSVDVELKAGHNEIVMKATGMNGKSVNEKDIVVCDNVAPELKLDEIPKFTKEVNVAVSGSVFDDYGVASVKVNNKEVVVKEDGTWLLKVALEEGKGTIEVVVTDKAGNRFVQKKEVVVDVTPPELDCDVPASLISDSKVRLTGTLEDDSPIDFLKINDEEVPMNEDGSWSLEFELKEGANEIEVKAIDKAGNEVTKTFSITSDATAPELTVADTKDVTTDTLLTISGTVKDANGIAFLNVNGKNVIVNQDGTWSVQIELLEGQNVIAVLATDKAGNSATYSDSILKDTVAPSLFVNAVEQGTTDGTVLVSGVATDAGGIASVTVNGVNASLNGDGSWSVEVTAGGSEIVVIATDHAGNCSTKTVNAGDAAPAPSTEPTPSTEPAPA